MPTSRTAEAAATAAASTAAAATAVDRVAAAVRADILSGILAPGEPLREEAAAIRYDVSRHTVRAAFQRLVAERLAVAETFRGVRVASFGRDEVIALQQLRAALEVEAVRIAGERFGGDWPDDALAPARAALGRLARLAADNPHTPTELPESTQSRATRDAVGSFAGGAHPEVDWLEVERAHADFHRALVATSDSPRIIEAHAALGSELLLFLLHVRPHYTIDTLIEEHRALLDELPTRGGDAVREHLEHSTRLLIDA
ncbi:GntR family transcriptional regulator [Agromyces humatus]|uniref:GntR family transcriptional regulator n=1 Tax=Agromyces humatus TaxID=279573 RepID=A0ABN2KMH5_9MICO|nr:GntR family transcriptional regulator [Agromyces humatus]